MKKSNENQEATITLLTKLVDIIISTEEKKKNH